MNMIDTTITRANNPTSILVSNDIAISLNITEDILYNGLPVNIIYDESLIGMVFIFGD